VNVPEAYAVPTTLAVLLNLRRLPARLDVADTAALLGFHVDDIPVLTKAGLLPHLGVGIADNAPKWFASVLVLKNAQDIAWLSEATTVVATKRRQKNERRTSGKNHYGEAVDAASLPAHAWN
jgi:hypothetical protein